MMGRTVQLWSQRALWQTLLPGANCMSIFHSKMTSALKQGARLVREWHGRAHAVTVTEDGFEYAGANYPSLSKIAKKITGAHWSGPRFFGLSNASRGKDNG